MVVTYYIKLFRTGADRHNAVLISLLLLVAEMIISFGNSNFDIENFFFSRLEVVEEKNTRQQLK